MAPLHVEICLGSVDDGFPLWPHDHTGADVSLHNLGGRLGRRRRRRLLGHRLKGITVSWKELVIVFRLVGRIDAQNRGSKGSTTMVDIHANS